MAVYEVVVRNSQHAQVAGSRGFQKFIKRLKRLDFGDLSLTSARLGARDSIESGLFSPFEVCSRRVKLAMLERLRAVVLSDIEAEC